MESLLPRLSHTLVHAKSLEELARPLLDMLQQVSKLDSTYLTRIDLPHSQQHVLYTCNRGKLEMPEGLVVPWQDTLCRRAMEDQQPYTADVQASWGDSEAARALGLHTYVSAPVRLPQGQLYGTLCAASGVEQAMSAEAMATLELFAGLIGQQVERELLLQELQQRNLELANYALTDALTGLPNRHALMEELPRMWARAERDGRSVLLAFIDLDGFKQINDQHGHEAGDQLLQTVARQLLHALRDSDFAARIGGDEFVMVGTGPELSQSATQILYELEERLVLATQCDVAVSENLLHYSGASVGVVAVHPAQTSTEQALALADAAMYENKTRRRARSDIH
ncbi:GGDEF domain-containing protein [Comamonas sp. UBA7528]|uniref:GGDEF domain-containing protein n=1 Tax=Comamonas sp. UBA7528 TaxID=1946391 RepID=UPI0025C66179|nr:sensor domain-containing diguanylate cyclase [Comamonas sp. UBA7528]